MLTAAPLMLTLLLPTSDGVPSSLAVAWVGEAKGPPRALLARFQDLSPDDAPPPRRYAYQAQLWRGEAVDKVLRFAGPAGSATATAFHFEATPTLDGFPERGALGLRWRADERVELRLGDRQPWQLLTEPLRVATGGSREGTGCQLTTARATLRGPGELRKGLALVEVCAGAAPARALALGSILLVDERGQGGWVGPLRAQRIALQPGSPPADAGVAAGVLVLERRACQNLWSERVLQFSDDSGALLLEPSHDLASASGPQVVDAALACSALLSGPRLDPKGRPGRVDALVMAVAR